MLKKGNQYEEVNTHSTLDLNDRNAGISGSYISDIEAGKRNFSVDVLMKIAEALQGIHRLDSTSRYTRNSSGAQSGYRAHPRRLISR